MPTTLIFDANNETTLFAAARDIRNSDHSNGTIREGDTVFFRRDEGGVTLAYESGEPTNGNQYVTFATADEAAEFARRSGLRACAAITLIADNGGGLTVQLEQGPQRYQWSTDSARDMADVLRAACAPDLDFSDWENNTAATEWVELVDGDIRNNGTIAYNARKVVSGEISISGWGANLDKLAMMLEANRVG